MPRKNVQGDLPMTEAQFAEFKAEGRNHHGFYNNKTFVDTGESVGHQEHWIMTVIYDGSVVSSVEGRDEPVRYYYAFDDPTNIETSEMQNQHLVGRVNLDRAEPVVDEEVGRQFEIVESNTFDSDDPLTELYHWVQDYSEKEE